MRLINFSPIITEYLRKENLVSPSIDTESELKLFFLKPSRSMAMPQRLLGLDMKLS